MALSETTNDQSLSRRLLDRDALLTPELLRVFGTIRAVQTACCETDTHYIRQSCLRRVIDGAPVLHARLEICKATVPPALLDALRHGETPFGQLLADFGIPVVIRKRTVFVTASGRYSRHVEIRAQQDETLICTVAETLVPDDQLVNLTVLR